MQRLASLALVTLWTSALCADTLTAQTLIVDPNGGTGTYKTIAAAVAAARSGATILIKPGTYTESVKVDGKALTILGLGATRTAVRIGEPSCGRLPLLTFANHPATGRSCVGNLALGRDNCPFPWRPTGVAVTAGGGAILFDDISSIRPWTFSGFTGRLFVTRCDVVSQMPATAATGFPGLSLDNVKLAVVNGGSFQGNPGAAGLGFGFPAGEGIRANRSRLELVHPRLIGGAGAKPILHPPPPKADGAPGLLLIASSARVTGVRADTITGGTAPSPQHASAGPGARLRSGSKLRYSGVTIRGGSGPGSKAFDVDATSTSSAQTPRRPALSLSNRLRLDTTTHMVVSGPTGNRCVCLVALDSTLVDLPFGPVFVHPSTLILGVLGTFDAQGQLRIPLKIPNDPNMEGLQLYMQAASEDAQKVLYAGGPTAGVIVR